ncbi:MAG: MFS transporter [Rhodospirillales bacterium]
MIARSWIVLAALALARIGFGYQFQSVASLGPDLIPLFNLSYAAFGRLIGAFMLLGVFVALPMGALGRRFGDRWVLVGGLTLMVLGAAIGTAADGPAGIAAGRTVAGVGAVAMIVLQGKIIADFFSGRQFMLAIAVSVCSYPIGVGLAQIVLPPIALAFGWRAGFLSCGVLTALALVLFLASYRAPAHIAGVSRKFALPSGRECLLLVVAGTIWAAYTGSYAGYTSYIPATLSLRGDGLAAIGLVMTIGTWGNVPATMYGGDLAARFGALRVLVFGTAALTIGIVGTALAGFPLGWSVLVGVIGAIHPGVIMAVGTLSAKPENRAVGMGIFYSVYYLGGTIGPMACGWAADLFGGPAGGLLMAAALSALVVPLFLWHRALADHRTMLVRP